MTRSNQTAPLPQLFLQLPATASWTDATACLAAFCRQVAHAASLLLPAPLESSLPRREALRSLRELAGAARDESLVVLMQEDETTASELELDGLQIHTGGAPRLARLRKRFGEDVILGACCPVQRHEAMELGEAGADYLLIDQRVEARGENLLTWWAEMFTVPVVAAHPASPQELPGLAGRGADFVIPVPDMWSDPETAHRLGAAYAAAVRQQESG